MFENDIEKACRYNELMVEYGGQIVNHCYAVTVDYEKTRVLMHEVSIALWSALDHLDPASTPRQINRWVQTIMRHAIYDHYRYAMAMHTEPLDEADAVAAPGDDDRELLDELMAYLPEADKRVLRPLLEGYTRAETAVGLGMSVNTLNQHVRRAVIKMKKIYEKLYGTDNPITRH